jgi:hypothetical protein
VLSIATVCLLPLLILPQEVKLPFRKISLRGLFKRAIERPVHIEEIRSIISTWVSYLILSTDPQLHSSPAIAATTQQYQEFMFLSGMHKVLLCRCF